MNLSRAIAAALVTFGLLTILAVIVSGAFWVSSLAPGAGIGEVQLAVALTVGAGIAAIALFTRLILPRARSRWRRV